MFENSCTWQLCCSTFRQLEGALRPGEDGQVEGNIHRELQIARQLLAQKKRDRALLFLKQKKIREQQIERLDAWLINVEQLVSPVRHAMFKYYLYTGKAHAEVPQKLVVLWLCLRAIKHLHRALCNSKRGFLPRIPQCSAWRSTSASWQHFRALAPMYCT